MSYRKSPSARKAPSNLEIRQDIFTGNVSRRVFSVSFSVSTHSHFHASKRIIAAKRLGSGSSEQDGWTWRTSLRNWSSVFGFLVSFLLQFTNALESLVFRSQSFFAAIATKIEYFHPKIPLINYFQTVSIQVSVYFYYICKSTVRFLYHPSLPPPHLSFIPFSHSSTFLAYTMI